MQFLRRSAHTGLSLVELLTGIALMGIMLAGTAIVLLNLRSSYSSADGEMQLRESAQLAMDSIARDVRSAGFPGCSDSVRDITAVGNAEDFVESPIRGYEAMDRGHGDEVLPSNAVSGSDALIVRSPQSLPRQLRLAKAMLSGSDALRIAGGLTQELRSGDVAMIFDCNARAYVRVASVTHDSIAHDSNLDYSFPAGTEVLPVRTTLYYVGVDSRGAPSLWRKIDSHPPTELAAGVSALHLQFAESAVGVDTLKAYVSANEVANWSAIRSVSVEVLVKPAEVQRASKGPHANAPAFRGLKSVIAIRNRMLQP